MFDVERFDWLAALLFVFDADCYAVTLVLGVVFDILMFCLVGKHRNLAVVLRSRGAQFVPSNLSSFSKVCVIVCWVVLLNFYYGWFIVVLVVYCGIGCLLLCLDEVKCAF